MFFYVHAEWWMTELLRQSDAEERQCKNTWPPAKIQNFISFLKLKMSILKVTFVQKVPNGKIWI